MNFFFSFLKCICFFLLISSCNQEKKQIVVAKVEGEEIFLHDVDDLIQNSLYEYLFAIFDVRRIVLDELVDSKLVKYEARRTGTNIDSIISQGVQKMRQKVSKRQFTEKNSLQNGVVEDGNPFKLIPLSSSEGQKILEKSYIGFLKQEFLKELRHKYNVKTYLDPPNTPKIKLDNILKYSRGKENSKVSFTLISDFTCPVCQSKERIFQELFEQYRNDLRFDYIQLSTSNNSSVLLAECVGMQHKFWQAYNVLFKQNIHSPDEIKIMIEMLKLNEKECLKCLVDKGINLKLTNNMNRIRSLGIEVTPTILINNRIYYGEISKSALSLFIEKELKK